VLEYKRYYIGNPNCDALNTKASPEPDGMDLLDSYEKKGEGDAHKKRNRL
tara:strand:+ start:121 stop:270 length:150 start_codon:yes stop_codon:yes gene_type:complete